MRKRFWFLQGLLVFGSYLASAMETPRKKAESTVPLSTNTPPEGNTTFLGGTSWCVALPGVSQVDLQKALDWACGLGVADCGPIQAGGPCFDPDTLVSHASYAFNSYYQQNGNSDVACNFGGTASLTTRDPSYGSCFFPNSGPVASSSSPPGNPRLSLWMLFGTLLLQLLRNWDVLGWALTCARVVYRVILRSQDAVDNGCWRWCIACVEGYVRRLAYGAQLILGIPFVRVGFGIIFSNNGNF